MNPQLKKNVGAFNDDVGAHGGYRYTVNAPFSSVVSNKRITLETERLLKSIPDLRTVIDVGCGDGTYTAGLSALFKDVKFTGFDPAEKAITSAEKNYPDCSFRVGNILDGTTLPRARFDVAVIRGVLHHLPVQGKAIENALLLSNRIIIIEPNGNNPILKWIEKHSKYHIEHEEQSFSSSFLERLFMSNGMAVEQTSFVGFVPFFFPELPARIIYFFQPLLERIPLMARYLGAQIIISAVKKS